MERRALLGLGAVALGAILAPRMFRGGKKKPVITKVDPPTFPTDVDFPMTIDGENFEPNLAVRLVIDGRVSPLNPGVTPAGQPRIQYVSPNRVLLWVRVPDPHTNRRVDLGIQFINPDGQQSNVGY
jgi:hypothetical protein